MTEQDDRDREIAALRERLSRLSEASLRINENLDLDTVLGGVLDSARSLTGARYAVITTFDDAGRLEDRVAAGMTPEEAGQLWEIPDGQSLHEYLKSMTAPLRVADLASHLRAMGLPELRSPVPISSCMVAPLRHRGVGVGHVYVGKRDPGDEFSRQDEETLVLFASLVALVIANARRHREERRVRADVETLIETSPVGVVVFDVTTGALKTFNREARRVYDFLRDPDQTPDQLLETMTFKRADGRELFLRDYSMADLLSIGETVRAEEIVLEVPDGRHVTALLNSTPINADDGTVESMVVTLQDMADSEEMERLRAEFLGMVSHELRTPLTSIRGAATTMLDTPSELDPAEVRQLMRIIVDQADNMRDLIGDLLDVARIETGSLSVTPEPVEGA
ncbi:MAG: GAF domain-containing protein, partial [Chloroflexi bacterium]|nr:GAF domain-containing protein [Chloroflexota bacterium]